MAKKAKLAQRLRPAAEGAKILEDGVTARRSSRRGGKRHRCKIKG
jgi:hypothetical protein